MTAMTRVGTIIAPAGEATGRFHDAKYAVFKRMYEDQMGYRALMEDSEAIIPSDR
jgi:hypothetical protein